MTRRVLVARLDSVGDVLVAGPAIRAIAAAAGTEVWMLCGPRGADAARLLPGVQRVLVWDSPWISDPAPAVTDEGVQELLQSLREARPAEAIILTSFHQSSLPLALLLRLAGVERIVAASVDYAGSLLDVRVRPGEELDENLPEPERALAIVAAAGYRLPHQDDGRLSVRTVADAVDRVPAGRYVVLHPGASVPARSWPLDHFVETAELLVQAGLPVVVTGGPDERSSTARVAGGIGLDLGGALDLAGLAAVLARAAAVIVGNTGPAHLAAAVGTPVVSLFSPVVPAARWAPYGVPIELLGDQHAACANSRARLCPVPGHPCLSSVTPQTAVAACIRLLKRTEQAEPMEFAS